ncbi:sigma-54 interaction domain-containing protein [Candidatus Hydrogenedentota bacterium]
MTPTNQPSSGPSDTILDSVADGVFTVDLDWKITSFNRSAEEITGISREDAIGQHCCDVFRASVCETECPLRGSRETGRPIVNKSVYILNSKGEEVSISVSAALLRDEDGQIIGGVETFRDLSVVEELRKELEGRHTFADIISKNYKMWQIFDLLPQIAESESSVLIEGESGTGKELFARAIHDLSSRKEKPLVTVNCGALPDTLIESELFGHRAGAFTDARQDRKGRFAMAEGGTIFLDEMGDLSPVLQVRLLRVLQEGTYEPLGADNPVRADVRVVAATHKDLAKEVEEGSFRRDLYYRVNVVRITLPPLRERVEDIPLLVDHFIGRFNRLRGKNISGISPEALRILMDHSFPGNVRELENIIEHSFVLCTGEAILPHHLPEGLRPQVGELLPSNGSTLKDMEADVILKALERNGWNRAQTARQLGIHKTTLYRRIKEIGVELPPLDGRRKRPE